MPSPDQTNPSAAPGKPGVASPRRLRWLLGVEWGMRIVLGGAFLASGVLKLLDPGLFAMAVRNFELIGDPWAPAIAVALPSLEMVTGLGVILHLRPIYRGSLLLLAASLAVFILALAVSWARGLEISCGCFGGNGEVTNYPLAILRNLVLIGLAAALWRSEGRNCSEPPGDRVLEINPQSASPR